MNPPVFVRRLGRKAACLNTEACPDVLLLADGNFAVIGLDITSDSAGRLPAGVGCGQGERIVMIPREVLVAARSDIPKA